MALAQASAAPPEPASEDGMTVRRQKAMALCAEAERSDLESTLGALQYEGRIEDLRRPETGLVMVRGRMGGDGSRFNFGEATVTRAAVRLETGETGFAYQLGRDVQKARMAAVLDALLQHPQRGRDVEEALEPLCHRLAQERVTRDRQTAATKVNFFTMVRGED